MVSWLCLGLFGWCLDGVWVWSESVWWCINTKSVGNKWTKTPSLGNRKGVNNEKWNFAEFLSPVKWDSIYLVWTPHLVLFSQDDLVICCRRPKPFLISSSILAFKAENFTHGFFLSRNGIWEAVFSSSKTCHRNSPLRYPLEPQF